MAISRLGGYGSPQKALTIPDKSPANYPLVGLLVSEFDIWREGYAGATVYVYYAGTTTLMPLYSDAQLTQAITNPQILLTKANQAGKQFGKFSQTIYVPFGYELDIDTTEQTGITQLPLLNLDGVDAKHAIVKPTGAVTERQLGDRFSDFIMAKDYGAIGTSPATNTTTLNAAIAAASNRGGCKVILPAGTIVHNPFSLPSGVILKGEGSTTTVLQCQQADDVVVVTGDSGGLEDLTLDGVNLNTGSTGLYGVAKDTFFIRNVIVKRFDVGVAWLGGMNHVYRNLTVTNCNTNMRLLGDQDSSNTNLGTEFSGLDWQQGEISQSTGAGLEMNMVDLPVRHNNFSQIDFLDNIGTDGALLLIGNQHNRFHNTYWEGNNRHITIEDNADTTLDSRQTVGIVFEGGQIVDGEVSFDGHCQDIIFDQVQMEGTEFILNVPENPILFRDSLENSTLFTGDSTKIIRWRNIQHGTVAGSTIDASPLVCYKVPMLPHEVIQLFVRATAEKTNGNDFADWVVVCGFRCAPATLNFDEQTANFTVGALIQGLTSGAQAIIAAQSDSGTTGSLSLGTVSGTFVDNEIITEVDGTGSARVNGAMVLGVVTAGTATTIHDDGSNTNAPPAGWTITFSGSVQEAQVLLTGAVATDITWNVNVDTLAL